MWERIIILRHLCTLLCAILVILKSSGKTDYWKKIPSLPLQTPNSRCGSVSPKLFKWLVSLRCAHATQTSWLQNIYCSTATYTMLWGGTCGQNRYHLGTSPTATWRSWGGQPLSWRWQSSQFSIWWRRRNGSSMAQKISSNTPENQPVTPRLPLTPLLFLIDLRSHDSTGDESVVLRC